MANHFSRYQYLGYWVEIFIVEVEGELFYSPYLELPNERGVIVGGEYGSWDEAEFAISELVNSWN